MRGIKQNNELDGKSTLFVDVIVAGNVSLRFVLIAT